MPSVKPIKILSKKNNGKTKIVKLGDTENKNIDATIKPNDITKSTAPTNILDRGKISLGKYIFFKTC